jgi:hypothetical protein
MKLSLSLFKRYLLVSFLLVVAVYGCAGTTGKAVKTTRIPVTIYKSAAIDIRSRNIEKIAVAPFFSDIPSENNIDNGMKASEMLAKSLTDTLIYTVKGPIDFNRDLLVNGLGLKPFMEKSQLQKIGLALKADAFFLGEVKNRKIKTMTQSKVITKTEEIDGGEFIKDEEGKLLYQPKTREVAIDMECKTKIGKVTLRYKLYNAKTGNLIFDKEQSLSDEITSYCYRANLSPEDLTRENEGIILDEITQELSNKFVEYLTPASETELVIFEKLPPQVDMFSENLLTIGIDYAKVGEWPKAIDNLKQCRDKNRDVPEVHYNLGVAYIGYGWHEKALAEFKEAYKQNPKKLYSEAIQNVKKLIEESRKNTED